MENQQEGGVGKEGWREIGNEGERAGEKAGGGDIWPGKSACILARWQRAPEGGKEDEEEEGGDDLRTSQRVYDVLSSPLPPLRLPPPLPSFPLLVFLSLPS